MEFTLIKALHVTTIAISTGSLFFLTFILAKVKKESELTSYKEFAPKLASYARRVMVFNVALIILSGFYLLFRFYSFEGVVILKTLLGVAVVTVFYAAPWFFKRFQKVAWFHHSYHLFLFAMMILTITIAQIS